MTQALTDWTGDVSSLLAEMKRRAGVRTDNELAAFMSAAQSTVSNWRKRGEVPESAILKFEAALANPHGDELARLNAAQAIALRIPELYYQRFRERMPELGRDLIYSYISISLGALTNEISFQMERLEAAHSMTTEQLRAKLIEDDTFLNGVLDWLEEVSLTELVARSRAFNERRLRL